MNLIEKIPEMTDDGVKNLLANARRLSESGTDAQRAASAELLPVLEAEAAKRQDERKAVLAERRAATSRAKPRKTAAAAATAEA